ncbi:hypothetical protein GCM10010218_61710 [Streptomyces mashuensis]|uniref:Chaplin domain-containing protein n=1 Tax=Streptomyces mashuensis TaxID=33904 RepID=A0A919EGK3_9ACTN|nr:chaplin [Streptomyces mashuensis]GHF72098.1 hypothetical protein GCM10010218_61710 [Streptomyces mashuensis]
MNSAKKAALALAAAGVAVSASVVPAVASDDGHGAIAVGAAKGSPGVISGNVIQVPIDIPVNVCGNTIDIIIGLLNPTFGNTCINDGGKGHHEHKGHHGGH